MALVKKSKIAADRAKPGIGGIVAPLAPAKGNGRTPAARPIADISANLHKPTAAPRNQTIAERVAAATEQLASGLTEASAASAELGRSMAQIASGAEEAASAAQEQSAAIKRIVANLGTGRAEADSIGRRSETASATLAETSAQIAASVRAIERSAERHLASVRVISELERRAKDIGEITQTVSRISDQTNLLALNAAIEAARAGDQGRGFAVVADEVRTLAETSDRSAQEVQRLADSMQTDVRDIVEALRKASDTATVEAKAAAAVTAALDARRGDMVRIAEDSRAIVFAAIESERAAVEAEKGAAQIAAAADEQSSGTTEAQSAIEQQAKSLDQSRVAAQSLALLADRLRTEAGRASASEQIGSSAEELSATIQELSSAASEISTALEQINKAAQLQASATHQTSAALMQIEKSTRQSQQNGKAADERVRTLETELKSSDAAVERLVAGVTTALEGTRASIVVVGRLEVVGRKIDKIVNAIALITVQTSMLAVSGSVEAARSGEAGRGFAVVSNDIRTLAREAADNIERAKDTVLGILDQIALLKSDLDQITISADLEVQNNRSVTLSLRKLGSEVDVLGKACKTIIQGADDILAAVAEAATGARQIASAAEEASGASRQAATAAAEQARGAEDLAAAIEEIGSLADELKRHNA